jgi:plasmid maintenance system antidote protein VapI
MSKRAPPVHLGEHVKEFMDDFGLTMNQLAKALHVPRTELPRSSRGPAA